MRASGERSRTLAIIFCALGLFAWSVGCGDDDPSGGSGGAGGSSQPLCSEACDVGLLCLPDDFGGHSCQCTGDSCRAEGPHSICDGQTRRCVHRPGTGGSGGDGGGGGGDGPCTPTTMDSPACASCLETAIPVCFLQASFTCGAEIAALLECAGNNGCMVGLEPDVQCTLLHCPTQSLAAVLCMRQCEAVGACF